MIILKKINKKVRFMATNLVKTDLFDCAVEQCTNDRQTDNKNVLLQKPLFGARGL